MEAACDKAGGGGGVGGGGDDEVYEEAAPLHGDKLFHAFLTRLRDNPGQILRWVQSVSEVDNNLSVSTETLKITKLYDQTLDMGVLQRL